MQNLSNNSFNDNFLKENNIIFKKYKPLKKIDRGAFGNIYSVVSLKEKNIFAMKTEKINAQQKTLESEAFYLLNLQGGIGIPKFITFGHTKQYNVLIETLLDKSLYNLFIKNKKKCHITDVCLIGHQIINRLEWIHSKNLIYRDIKPENFLIGKKDPNIIYVVDFGLCKRYRSSKTGKHIMPKLTGKFNGTLIYASPNVVKGKESSRRDDIISLGYMLIYLLKRNLPWESSFQNLNKAKYYQLIYLKETNGCMKLFDNIPSEFADYINYSRNLSFEQEPNYAYLRSLFNKILFSLNLSIKKMTFSWVMIKKNISTKKPILKNKLLKQIKDEESENNSENKFNNLKSDIISYNMNDYKSNYIPKKEFNINNIYSEKIYLNNNNNININNINLEKLYLNNNKVNLNNINSERIYLNNDKINLNQISEIINFDNAQNPYINNTFNGQKSNYKNRIKIINKKFKNSSNVMSERVNFKNFHFNKINGNNNSSIFKFKANDKINLIKNKNVDKVKLLKNKINKNISYFHNHNNKDSDNPNLSDNIFYKSPLESYLNTNKNMNIDSEKINNQQIKKAHFGKENNINLNYSTQLKSNKINMNNKRTIQDQINNNIDKNSNNIDDNNEEIQSKRYYSPYVNNNKTKIKDVYESRYFNKYLINKKLED